MLPNLRSVVAQVHRRSLSIRSRRNFSSDPSSKNVSKGAAEGAMDIDYPKGTRAGFVWRVLTRGLTINLGFYIGEIICGDVVADIKKRVKGQRRTSRKQKRCICRPLPLEESLSLVSVDFSSGFVP
ncbi:unnamed protein product [Microthlaspi erraticum]|uniref:Uncharacterized protein n=1 Tax=Microthlaspi erraticum TaxID=1685480 RepID=A0A6D2HPH4_9BRAS|nr:unnamed protein product [Microthlaspi erraticum]